MPYKVIIKKSAAKNLKSIPISIRLRIVGAIDLLAVNPFPPNSKKLVGRPGYRIRIANYRVIYTVENSILTITVIDIGHRREIYE